MKKRLLGILLCLCMVLTIFPALAFAEGDEPETPVCTCETACTLDAMNADCPICGAEGAVPEGCGKYEAPAETPTCTCETACTLDAMNADCPVCGAEGTVPESCGQYTAPAGGTVDLQDLDGTVKQAPADDTEELQKLLDNADGGSAVTLTKDYTISSTLTVRTWITLDLAGHVIRMTGSGSVIEVYGILTLTDSNPGEAHPDDPSLPAGGVITGGNAAIGGGVYVDAGDFTMESGTIFGCTAGEGGGVYAEHDSHFIMKGGAIEGCTADNNGQAVYITRTQFSAGYGTIKGTVYVEGGGGIVTDAGASYARFYDQVTIENGFISAGIYYGGIDPGSSAISTNNYHTVSFELNGGSGSIPTQYFVNVAGPLALKPADPTKDGYTFAGWYRDEALTVPFDFENDPIDGDPVLYAKFEDGTQALQKLLNNPPADGLVKLEQDYTISETVMTKENFTLDLNGHVIRMTRSGSVLCVGANVTLTDSNPTATHEDSSLPAGGVITGATHAERGGGVYAAGAFTMAGGTIYNCHASDGGGVYSESEPFTMTGGAIEDCTADNGGGVYSAEKPFTMTGGAIKGCSAEFNGGGVFAQRCVFTMTGGAIEDCTANIYGQAVYIYGAVFSADGGTVKGTVYATDNGRIVHVAGTSYARFYDQVTIENGTIRYGVYYGGIAPGPDAISETYHTVRFDLNGGSGDIPTQFFVGIDTATALQPADPTKDGAVFAGWFTDAALTTPYDFTAPVTGNLTLYAGYVYTITYDPGEYGTGSIPAGTKEHGKNFILTTDTFTRQGYVQYAWISAENDWYPLGGTYSIDANVTLYPVWDKIEAMTVPFTTTVTLGSSAVPGKTVFELEILDANGKPVSNDAVTVSGSVTTNGADSYKGALTFTGPELQIQSLFRDTRGVFVRQVDAGAAGWTLDGTVWGVTLHEEESNNTESGVACSLRIYPVKVVDGKYVLDSNAGPVEQMLFTNVYTHTHRYSQHYNDTEHWDECPCGDVQNRALHSFTKHYDETHHWDECDCGYAKNEESHSFGEWVVKTPATATAAGLQERECTGCDYVQSSPIPPLGHTHSYTPHHDDTHHWDECTCGDVVNKELHSFTQRHDDTHHWDECACGYVQGLEAHSYGDWTVSIRPTGSSTGLKVRSCTGCGYQQTAEIPPLKPTDSPATGDSSALPLWFALFAVSAAGLALTGVSIRRRRSAKAK